MPLRSPEAVTVTSLSARAGISVKSVGSSAASAMNGASDTPRSFTISMRTSSSSSGTRRSVSTRTTSWPAGSEQAAMSTTETSAAQPLTKSSYHRSPRDLPRRFRDLSGSTLWSGRDEPHGEHRSYDEGDDDPRASGPRRHRAAPRRDADRLSHAHGGAALAPLRD